MRKSLRGFSVALAVLALAAQAQAGGFWLALGNPEASNEARALNAAVTVRAIGCADPASNAKITGNAIGIVEGRRQTIPLKLTAMRDPGLFAVTKQWPDQGRWIIQFVGRSGTAVTTTLAAIGPDGVDRYSKKEMGGEASEAEISAFLNEAGTVARK